MPPDCGVRISITNLRFPGHYEDEETRLFENWHRFYDASTGRYLQPEPLLRSPNHLASEARRGSHVSFYAYALSNFIGNTDSDGLRVRITADRVSWFNTLQDATWVLRNDPGVNTFFERCFGQNPFTNDLDHEVHGSADSPICNATGFAAWTSGSSSVICSSRFTNPPVGPPGTSALHIAKSIMHELTHQLAPYKTNDSAGALGCETPKDECSAKEAEEVATRAFARNYR